MRLILAVALLALVAQDKPKDLLEKKCDAAVTEIADWCRACDKAAEAGKHDGHDVAKLTVCVRKIYTNGCCVRAEPGAG